MCFCLLVIANVIADCPEERYIGGSCPVNGAPLHREDGIGKLSQDRIAKLVQPPFGAQRGVTGAALPRYVLLDDLAVREGR